MVQKNRREKKKEPTWCQIIQSFLGAWAQFRGLGTVSAVPCLCRAPTGPSSRGRAGRAPAALPRPVQNSPTWEGHSCTERGYNPFTPCSRVLEATCVGVLNCPITLIGTVLPQIYKLLRVLQMSRKLYVMLNKELLLPAPGD